jgi:hypothetical protein
MTNPPLIPNIEPADSTGGVSFWQDAWHRLWKNKLAVFGLVVITLLAVMSVTAALFPKITGYT